MFLSHPFLCGTAIFRRREECNPRSEVRSKESAWTFEWREMRSSWTSKSTHRFAFPKAKLASLSSLAAALHRVAILARIASSLSASHSPAALARSWRRWFCFWCRFLKGILVRRADHGDGLDDADDFSTCNFSPSDWRESPTLELKCQATGFSDLSRSCSSLLVFADGWRTLARALRSFLLRSRIVISWGSVNVYTNSQTKISIPVTNRCITKLPRTFNLSLAGAVAAVSSELLCVAKMALWPRRVAEFTIVLSSHSFFLVCIYFFSPVFIFASFVPLVILLIGVWWIILRSWGVRVHIHIISATRLSGVVGQCVTTNQPMVPRGERWWWRRAGRRRGRRRIHTVVCRSRWHWRRSAHCPFYLCFPLVAAIGIGQKWSGDACSLGLLVCMANCNIRTYTMK